MQLQLGLVCALVIETIGVFESPIRKEASKDLKDKETNEYILPLTCH